LKMLKLVGIFIGVALIVAALAAVVWAQGPRNGDGDGVCDGCGAAASDGLQRGWRFNQEGEPPCDQFVDEDGDGVCDLCGAADGDGLRRGWRFNQEGEPPCGQFVDEDGDGICDLCGQAAGDGLQCGWRFDQGENERGPYSGTGGRMGGGRMRTP
jgi:hypothetical protein